MFEEAGFGSRDIRDIKIGPYIAILFACVGDGAEIHGLSHIFVFFHMKPNRIKITTLIPFLKRSHACKFRLCHDFVVPFDLADEEVDHMVDFE
jgi:hypothetical protein